LLKLFNKSSERQVCTIFSVRNVAIVYRLITLLDLVLEIRLNLIHLSQQPSISHILFLYSICWENY